MTRGMAEPPAMIILGLMFGSHLGDLIVVNFHDPGLRTPYCTALNHLPDWLGRAPWVRWPPASRLIPRMVSPGLQKRLEHTLVGLAAGIGLHIGKFAAEQLFGAVDGQVLGHIDDTGSRRNSAGPG